MFGTGCRSCRRSLPPWSPPRRRPRRCRRPNRSTRRRRCSSDRGCRRSRSFRLPRRSVRRRLPPYSSTTLRRRHRCGCRSCHSPRCRHRYRAAAPHTGRPDRSGPAPGSSGRGCRRPHRSNHPCQRGRHPRCCNTPGGRCSSCRTGSGRRSRRHPLQRRCHHRSPPERRLCTIPGAAPGLSRRATLSIGSSYWDPQAYADVACAHHTVAVLVGSSVSSAYCLPAPSRGSVACGGPVRNSV